MEAKVEAFNTHLNSSQNISALLLNQFGKGGSAPASGDAAGDVDDSGSLSSKQHMEKSFRFPDNEQLGTIRKSMQERINSKILCQSEHQCQFCFNLCASEADLKQHILSHLPEIIAQKYCGSKYVNDCKKVLHKRCLSKLSSVKKFSCSECQYSCTTKRDMRRHFLRKHSTEKPIRCSECDYACTTKYSLKRHFLYKHATEKPIQCSECDYACTTKKALRSHFLYKHSTEKPFPCSECDHACTTKWDLKTHFLSKHSIENPFQCSKCNYVYTTKRALKRHFICKHSTEKSIQCSECDYACTTKEAFKSHFRYKHSTEKPSFLNEDSPTCLPFHGPPSSPDFAIITGRLLLSTSWAPQVALNSDHLPILLHLPPAMESPAPWSNRSYTNFRKVDWPSFTAAVEAALEAVPAPTSCGGESTLRSVLAAAAKQHIPAGFRKELDVAEADLSELLQGVSDWSTTKKLAVAPGKSSVTLFTPDTHQSRLHPSATICNGIIPLDKTPKILGVTWDNLFTFSPHVRAIATRATSSLRISKALAGTN
ncbi:zinc finger protein-like [Hyalella azteca]|uniref:Zinc finger protein-like n=1 Tax=Hyalella azteca TaxID=294128 RepID=A0A979FXP9_HYAAZ|nr:zinc finger protein-like [Hyalella azteca]